MIKSCKTGLFWVHSAVENKINLASSSKAAEFIQMQFWRREAVKCTELCAPLGDVINPDMMAFGFSMYLRLPQKVQSSASDYFGVGC